MATNPDDPNKKKDTQIVDKTASALANTYNNVVSQKKQNAQDKEAQSAALDQEVSALLSRQSAGRAQYEGAKKSGLLYMTNEEQQKAEEKIYAPTSWTETWSKDSHSYEGDFSTAQEKITGMIGASEEKRRSEYYKNLAAAQNKGIATNTQKAANSFQNGSILSPKKSSNLLGL